MSILIRGMEMPASCGDCKAFVCYKQWAGDIGDCFCGITKNDAKAKEKNADCPLVQATDVRPVVRGKWISENDGKTIVRMKYGEPQDSCKCSICGEWLTASDEYDVKGNFCPNCGADMREES